MSNQVYRNELDKYDSTDNDIANFKSHVWVQLAGQLAPSGTAVFDTNTLLTSKTTLNRNTWYKVKTGVTASPDEIVGQASANYTLQRAEDWTFDPVSGDLTCNKRGKYTIVYNVSMRRTLTPNSYVLFIGIGGNGNPPNLSIGGGGGSSGNSWESLSATCVDEVANNGDTRALYVRFQGDNATETIEIGALNLVWQPIVAT